MKIKKIIEKSQTNANVKSIEICSFSPQMKNEDDFDMILLFQTIQHEDILSTMKIAVISPFIKIKFYTDIN